MSNAVLKGHASGTGTVTLETPNTNSDRTISLPDSNGTVMVSGNMPAFSAYNSGDQTISSGTLTKVTLDTEIFDTNNNFASSRFTPTVAGYYQLNATVRFSTSVNITNALLEFVKNGSEYSRNAQTNGLTITANFAISASTVMYFNGTTDYVELWGLAAGTGTLTFNSAASYVSCTFNGAMVRSS